jgi:hypothetical protein
MNFRQRDKKSCFGATSSSERVDKTQCVRYNVPTVIREEGFEARIYTFDHPPPHVHVATAGAIVRIDLATHEVTELAGDISDRDVKRAERLVARHAKQPKEVGEDSWERLTSHRRIASGMRERGRGDRHARNTRQPL